MKAPDIVSTAPGSIILLCCPDAHQKRMTDALLHLPDCLPDNGKSCSRIVHMTMTEDNDPREFFTLNLFARDLVRAAGYNKHFEGLVLLNVRELMEGDVNASRLQALGEFISLPKGLCSTARVVIYGPSNRREMNFCADHLDANGMLLCADYDPEKTVLSLREALVRFGMTCDKAVLPRLRKAYAEVMDCSSFKEEKYLRSLTGGSGRITATSLDQGLTDQYSYHNRLCAARNPVHERRIGFGN